MSTSRKRTRDHQSQNGQRSIGSDQVSEQNGTTSKMDDSIPRVSGWSCQLVHHDALPTFLQDNEYLINHHRPQLSSFSECVKSAFRLHTETWNIWTHTIPFFWVVVFAVYQMSKPRDEMDLEHKMAYTPIFVASVFCFGASGCFHTFLCHSEEMHCLFSKFDYCGVIGMIVLSCTSWLYYGFYCHFYLQAFYIMAILCCGLVSICIVMHDKFSTPAYRIHRAILFISLGLSCGVPGINFIILNYGSGNYSYLPWLLAMAAIYVIGGVVFAVRIPERLKPGLFDIWFHSHQILHLCVVGGFTCCYIGITELSRIQIGTCDTLHQVA